jgi:hypothetical protein
VRKGELRILAPVPSRTWKIAFRNFAIACSGKVAEIFKVVGKAELAGREDQEDKLAEASDRL